MWYLFEMWQRKISTTGASNWPLSCLGPSQNLVTQTPGAFLVTCFETSHGLFALQCAIICQHVTPPPPPPKEYTKRWFAQLSICIFNKNFIFVQKAQELLQITRKHLFFFKIEEFSISGMLIYKILTYLHKVNGTSNQQLLQARCLWWKSVV